MAYASDRVVVLAAAVEIQQLANGIGVGDVGGPAVGTGNGSIESCVRVGDSRPASVVEVRQCALPELLRGVHVPRNGTEGGCPGAGSSIHSTHSGGFRPRSCRSVEPSPRHPKARPRAALARSQQPAHAQASSPAPDRERIERGARRVAEVVALAKTIWNDRLAIVRSSCDDHATRWPRPPTIRGLTLYAASEPQTKGAGLSVPISYVRIDAHKVELHMALLAPDAFAPVTWKVQNEALEMEPLRRKLAKPAGGSSIACRYQAGPCGYVLQRQLERGQVQCQVIAPALVPRKPGRRAIKTDRFGSRALLADNAIGRGC